MAYDLVFWADSRTDPPEPKLTYLELLQGKTVNGLGPFGTRAVLDALGADFPDLIPPPTGETGWTAWEAPDALTAFEFNWSPQYLVATARGRYTNDQMNRIIDLCGEVGGGRLYDPQTDERFDSR